MFVWRYDRAKVVIGNSILEMSILTLDETAMRWFERNLTLRTLYAPSSVNESPYEGNKKSASCEERDESYDGFARPTGHCDTLEMCRVSLERTEVWERLCEIEIWKSLFGWVVETWGYPSSPLLLSLIYNPNQISATVFTISAFVCAASHTSEPNGFDADRNWLRIALDFNLP